MAIVKKIIEGIENHVARQGALFRGAGKDEFGQDKEYYLKNTTLYHVVKRDLYDNIIESKYRFGALKVVVDKKYSKVKDMHYILLFDKNEKVNTRNSFMFDGSITGLRPEFGERFNVSCGEFGDKITHYELMRLQSAINRDENFKDNMFYPYEMKIFGRGEWQIPERSYNLRDVSLFLNKYDNSILLKREYCFGETKDGNVRLFNFNDRPGVRTSCFDGTIVGLKPEFKGKYGVSESGEILHSKLMHLQNEINENRKDFMETMFYAYNRLNSTNAGWGNTEKVSHADVLDISDDDGYGL